MAIVTGDRYLDLLARFIEQQAGALLDGGLVLKLNPVGLHYVQTRLEALQELEELRREAPVDYLRAYVADLGDHRALEKLRRVLRLLGSLQVVAVLPPPARDPTPITLLPFARLKSLELRGCDLSTSAARGLLELRPILEKLICHNSANALRHIFAEQTVEIQDAQVWSRLAAVACPCNGLVLMDESLHLLPAVDALDLSRNNLAKVANLQKCSRLKFLDLGFNHITSVASLNQELGNITKLVLRNNALVSTRGIEKLYSLEALDLSHNVISNFHEVETLGCLFAIQSLWLKGNPITVSSYYREEVFSYFHDPHKLELDGKSSTKLERWVMGRIISRRVRRRACYGVYVPAKSSYTSAPDDAGQPSEAPPQPRLGPRKKNIRLASIDDTGGEKLAGGIDVSQQDVQTPGAAEGEAAPAGAPEVTEQVDPEVAELIQQIESMKREGSSTWLNNLVGFWESDGPYASGDDNKSAVSANSPNSATDLKQKSKQWSWMKRRRRGKDEARRKLEDVAVPKDLREAVRVLETVTRTDAAEDEGLADSEDVDDSSPLSWPAREDGFTGQPTSPPHFDSDLLHRRQSLVNELLRLPLDLSATSSDSDSDSLSGPSVASVSDTSGSAPGSPSSATLDKEGAVPDVPCGPGEEDDDAARPSSTTAHSDENGAIHGEKNIAVTDNPPAAATQSPSKSDDIVADAGPAAGNKRRQKQTRRIVILEPDKDADDGDAVSIVGPASAPVSAGARAYQADFAPQLAAPPLSLAARNLPASLAGTRASSLSARRSPSLLAGLVRRSSSSLAHTVKISGDLGPVNSSQRTRA